MAKLTGTANYGLGGVFESRPWGDGEGKRVWHWQLNTEFCFRKFRFHGMEVDTSLLDNKNTDKMACCLNCSKFQ